MSKMSDPEVKHRTDRARATPILFGHLQEAEKTFYSAVHRSLDDAKRVCDIGGGGKPVLRETRINDHGLDYLVLDVSEEQLARTPECYRTVQMDILDKQAVPELVKQNGPFDLVISKWAAEHMLDGMLFHEQVFSMLRPGGRAVHWFPTLYALPFVVNRLLSARLSAALLFGIFREREKKFPAHYSWCRGPTPQRVARLEAIGYDVDLYVGFFGHSLYKKMPPLNYVHKQKTRLLVAHPNAQLTSFAVLSVKRPS